MSALNHIFLESKIDRIETALKNLYKDHKFRLTEEDKDENDDDCDYMFLEAKKQYATAKKGLSLCESETDPKRQKAIHRKIEACMEKCNKIMGHIKKLNDYK